MALGLLFVLSFVNLGRRHNLGQADALIKSMNIKRIITFILCLTFCAAAVGCGSSASEDVTVEKGVLKVGVRDFVPGFGYKNPESGVYSGLEIDIAKDLAKKTEKTLELVAVDNAQRTQFLDDGEADCIIATFSETEERKKKYDFSTSYYSDYVRILVKKSAEIGSIKDLAGLTVGIVENSTAAKALVNAMIENGYIDKVNLVGFNPKTFNGGISFKTYTDYSELAYALETGDVDAAAGDGSLLVGYNDDSSEFLTEKLEEQHYAICMKKGSPLKDTADSLVNELLADGTIDQYMINHGLKE